MKNKKSKYYLKNNLIGLIIGGIIFGSLGVYAAITFPSNEVSFDPSNSTLKSTNVKSAIDELYKKCTNPSAADQIIEDAGLEKDPYECRYFFTGANPNNYITFNNEIGWRIISVECDGTIKIIKNDNTIDQLWNTSFSNDWTTASLNDYLNKDYYSSLTSTAQSQITSHDFSIGYTILDSDLPRSINTENATKWNGNIALITVTEYVRANSNKSSCGSSHLHFFVNESTCYMTNWLSQENSYWWTLSRTSGSGSAYYIDDFSRDLIGADVNKLPREVRPVLYLSSNIKITSGDGSKSNPYTIE